MELRTSDLVLCPDRDSDRLLLSAPPFLFGIKFSSWLSMAKSEESERKLCSTWFFKVMVNNFSEQMLIPKAFSKRSRLIEIISKDCLLTTYKGTWRIQLRAENEIEIYFADGWATFIAHHKIRFGEILVFEQLDKSNFFVYVFGHSGCMKDFDKCTRMPIKEEAIDEPLCQTMNQQNIKSQKMIRQPQLCSNSAPNFVVVLNASNCHPKKPYMHIPIEFVRSAGLRAVDTILIEDISKKVWTFQLDRGTKYTNGNRRIKLRKDWASFRKANNLSFGDKCIFELTSSPGKRHIPFVKFRVLPH